MISSVRPRRSIPFLAGGRIRTGHQRPSHQTPASLLDPTKRASKVRRWLTYWTLLVAAGALLGDVTTLVYNLLGGELTVRFVLKIVTVGLIAGTAFTYYLRDLRHDEAEIKA